jgi:hypothetical protein
MFFDRTEHAFSFSFQHLKWGEARPAGTRIACRFFAGGREIRVGSPEPRSSLLHAPITTTGYGWIKAESGVLGKIAVVRVPFWKGEGGIVRRTDKCTAEYSSKGPQAGVFK